MRKRLPWIGAASAFLALASGVAGAGPVDPFDPVWEIMTVDAGPESPGCRGCHIQPLPPHGLIWGDTEAEVLASLEDRDPDTGEVRGVVAGGNNGSEISYLLECGSMPFAGRPWHEGPDDTYCDEFFQFQLEKLRAWLAQYDDPTADPTSCQ
jgi:hypothetical protein